MLRFFVSVEWIMANQAKRMFARANDELIGHNVKCIGDNNAKVSIVDKKVISPCTLTTSREIQL